MPRRLTVPGLIAVLFTAACSKPDRGLHQTGLPDIPRLKLTTFRPQIRDQIQKGYEEVTAKPKDPDANGRMGMLLHAFEQYETAELCYRRAHSLDPSRFQWAYYLGLVQAIDGRNEDAAATLGVAIRLEPEYLPARIKLAEVLLNLGRAAESRKVCESMAKDYPQSAPVYYWLGRVASANGQANLAMQNYRKACDLWPSYGTAHYALALACQKTGETADAQAHMAAYQKYKADGDPQPEDNWLEAVRSLDNSALAHLMKGVDLENADQLDQAIAEHEQAVRIDPKLAQAHANLIGLYGRVGRADMAEKAYRYTVALNPNLPQSHYDYGVFLVSRQRFREAATAFHKAIEASPHYAEAHSNLGAMLEHDGKIEEAIQHYKAAIEDKPNYRHAHFQLGRLLLIRHRNAEAIAELGQALTPEDQDTPRFMYALGLAYAESGDYRSAARYLREAGQRAASFGQSQLLHQIEMSLRKVNHQSAQ